MESIMEQLKSFIVEMSVTLDLICEFKSNFMRRLI